ncbi:hypothetical protein PB1_04425 [Bacillus methanolicus PB1]|uniref:Uncharacterized protein n=1 Tax=Bacillus methanolicus PB1 TaxID=997296 RepID=I3E6N2_BACMT|nr:hypothetical protein PB1_04425 [Bacillus methanolicus PB1]
MEKHGVSVGFEATDNSNVKEAFKRKSHQKSS